MSKTGHRLRLGTHVVVNLTSTYALSNTASFPIQADQIELPWAVTSVPFEKPELITALSEEVFDEGRYRFEWIFSGMTFGMHNYFFSTFYASNRSLWTVDVTALTYDGDDVATYFNAKMTRPNPARLQRNPYGYLEVVYRFTHGVIIT